MERAPMNLQTAAALDRIVPLLRVISAKAFEHVRDETNADAN